MYAKYSVYTSNKNRRYLVILTQASLRISLKELHTHTHDREPEAQEDQTSNQHHMFVGEAHGVQVSPLKPHM